MPGPLTGVRIIDLTTVLMGPSATQILGDMGADVIKVETPQGDMVRELAPALHPGMGAMFMHVNRSKRSIVLDLKQPAGHAALLRLAAGAAALIYNVRPQAMTRLGLGYDDLKSVNPGIVYAGLFGYGQDGPYASWPAYDDLIQGATGLASLAVRAGSAVPRYVPLTLADRMVGLTAVGAIMGALFHRERTGEGQRVDVPMFETMASIVLGDHMAGLTYDPPVGPAGYARLLSHERKPYPTRDGYICALIYNDKQWRAFFRAIGRDGVVDTDPRFADVATRSRHIDALYAELADIMKTRTTAEWLALLRDADIPAMPMNTPEMLMDDPHLRAVGFFRTIDHPSEGRVRQMAVPSAWSATQPAPSRPTPLLGEHSVEVLREAGYEDHEITAMVEAGVTASPVADAAGRTGAGE